MIEIRGLAKSFGDLRVVENVSFLARDGEITGLIGPNGAGKTTLFRLICTVLRPDSGMTLIDGIDSQHDPLAARRRLGVLPDIRGLYPRRSLSEADRARAPALFRRAARNPPPRSRTADS